jgi:hypothetical protein
MAGVPGLEPGPKVLETSMLTIDTIPLCTNGKLKVKSENRSCRFSLSVSAFHLLFVLFVQRMAATAAAELLKLQPVRRVLFVLGRYVIALFALRALQNYVISRHFVIPYSRFQIPN